jgi:trimeric autotransporter adhesin
MACVLQKCFKLSATAVESLAAGIICATTGFATPVVGTCGKSLKVSAIGDYQFVLQADGNAGTSTVTVTSSVAGWTATKSATFYSKAAKTITATVAHPLLKVGTNGGAVRVTGVDAGGVNWTGSFYIVASAAADALVGGSATTPVACGAYDATVGYAACDITTLTTGTAKFKVIDASTVALATATSNEVTTTVTNAVPASVKLSFDKATYAPNERARIYVTPLDAAGKEMQSITADLLAATGITVNGAISLTGTTTTTDSLTATSITTSASTSSTSGAKAGSRVLTVYMPSAGGTVTLSATGGSGLPVAARVAVTASATVTDSGAAALAAVTALATTVASLKTLITTLTNLVLKIQKKVKA